MRARIKSCNLINADFSFVKYLVREISLTEISRSSVTKSKININFSLGIINSIESSLRGVKEDY